MLSKERAYQFRERLDCVHHAIEQSVKESAGANEVLVDGSWGVKYPENASEITMLAVQDTVAYFRETFGIVLSSTPTEVGNIQFVDNASDLASNQFKIEVSKDQICLSASTPRMLRRAGVALEDRCNLRNAPIVECGQVISQKLISPRIVHSGWGIELFPDAHLNAILHAGFDAIAVFTKGYDKTNVGVLDFSDLIRRAARYDVDFYFYSYLPSYKHPDDPDAEEFFEGVYTRLFERYPEAAGVMLVGESTEFPSKDPATTGKRWYESRVDGIRATKPSPGWWPCTDYPAWLTRVRDAVWKVRRDARIIFNTYNWDWASLEMRRKFLSQVPEGITIQVTYDVMADNTFFGVTEPVMDYSITATEPGYYFDTECHAAAEFKLPLLSTANTAGTTWDFGDVPYIPVPQRWIRRFKRLNQFHNECGLNAFYDCHHYGWWPSVITELGKAYFYSPQVDLEEHLKKLAVALAGAGAQDLLQAWQCWSDAFDFLPATNEEQYGPLRVGPSYPLIFQPNITRTMDEKEIKFPTNPDAHFGYCIIKTLYQPYENATQPPAFIRYPAEIKALEQFQKLWRTGIDFYEKAIAAAPVSKRERLERECNIGRFMANSALTALRVKRWWVLNQTLQVASSVEEANKLLDQIEELAHQEIENARDTMPIVNQDSRLGWEPSMEYVCDQWHLEWKIRQVESTLLEIADFRQSFSSFCK